MPIFLRGILMIGLAALLSASIMGCDSKPKGKYVGVGGLMSVEFNGNKAILSSTPGPSETCDYTVDGDKITIKSKAGAGDIVLTRMQDGSLQGNGVTFTKSAG